MYHFYRIPVSSQTGTKLTEIYRQGKIAAQAASKLAESFKAVEFEMNPLFAMGGISALYFNHKPSVRRWDIREKQHGIYLCIPNTATTAGRKALQQMDELPVVKMEQVAEAFGIDPRKRPADHQLLPMFFRVENEWDYIKCDTLLSCPGLQETTEEMFNKALDYVSETTK